MRKLVYYVAVTLDGRIAGPAGEFDFFPQGDAQQTPAYLGFLNSLYPETIPTAFRAGAGVADVPNRRFDTVVMGRATHQLDPTVPSPYAHLRQYVVSSMLKPDLDPAVTVVPGDPVGLVRDLKKEETGKDIWLCGGGKLAGALLPEIDEIVLKSYPVVAGAGIPMVEGGFDPTVFSVAERTAFPNGVTATRLVRN
ncbi:dihydrofolate reductase family protein [Amycolatopsis echigonensis]|uniref:Dihydrofolate reductase n=1 Tax=Amycolatopsis echigonensis TaxID=2576905 RepID=A0A2N3WC17_9PSEU|nr:MULTISPECIES: dihydrofolate reductase family protein [Amycolatopsis]MBB2505101.1 dihydrofolate reductase family protein [Amycolatopsis echigonensis]PKV91432.1 dihydrofolate reductase [Amycolatopsis niigatensis]